MIWALMLADYANWHNDPEFVKARAIGLRSMLEHFEPYREPRRPAGKPAGLAIHGLGAAMENGDAPDGVNGISALNNLLYVAALQKSAEVEDGLGEPLLAQRLRAKAARTAEAVKAKFWDEARGLIADNLAHTEFSEHGQCLALLTDTLIGDQAKRCFEQLLVARDLKRTTIYFSFYLLETWRKFGRGDLIVERMSFWKDLVKQGLKTPVEMPGDYPFRLPRLGQSSSLPSACECCRHPPGFSRLSHRSHCPCPASCRRSSLPRRTRTDSSNSISHSTAIAAAGWSSCPRHYRRLRLARQGTSTFRRCKCGGPATVIRGYSAVLRGRLRQMRGKACFPAPPNTLLAHSRSARWRGTCPCGRSVKLPPGVRRAFPGAGPHERAVTMSCRIG